MALWAKRLILGTAGLLTLTAMVGASWEAVTRVRVSREFPVAGKLIDIGGRNIQLDCRGAGSPTVVLEGGLDILGSLTWAAVHDSLAATTRVCAYSRAGVMWSDPSNVPFSSSAVAADVRAALTRAGEPTPLVLVSHSIGGLYSMKYTELYGADVAGLVMIDASHPDQVARLEAATGASMLAPTGSLSIASALSRTGLLRLVAPDLAPATAPPVVHQVPPAFLPISIGALTNEAKQLKATFAGALAFRSLGNRPLVVLTAMAPMPAAERKAMGMTERQGQLRDSTWSVLQGEEAGWSTNSRHESFPDASHYIQFDRPDAVIRAVREVVASVRNNGVIALRVTCASKT